MEQNHLDTIKKMIHVDRGWIQDSYRDPDIESIQNELQKNGQTSFFVDTNNSYLVIVKSSQFSKNFKKNDYQQIMKPVNKNNLEHIIVLTESQATSDTKKILQELTHPNVGVETFKIIEIAKDKTQNYLIPKHELIRDRNQIEEIMNELQITSKEQLSKILTTDFMARHFYAQKDDIMKIYREQNVAYRHVVEGS
jgi:DNA-directed RNA polymerase subunit H (RpoH/RPB5)